MRSNGTGGNVENLDWIAIRRDSRAMRVRCARWVAMGGAYGVMERLTRVSWTVGGPNSIFCDRDEKRL